MKYIRLMIVASLMLPAMVRCQEGFKAGVDFPVVSVFTGDVAFDPAVGINFRFPYGIDNNLSVGAKIGGAHHRTREGELVLARNDAIRSSYSSRTWTLWWLLVDFKYLIGDSAATRPFINGELGFGSLVGTWDNQLYGFAIGGGGGVEHFISSRWSMNVAADIRYHDFRSGTIGGSSVRLSEGIGQVVINLSVGITYHIPR